MSRHVPGRVALRFAALALALLGLPGCVSVISHAVVRASNPEPPWNGEVVVDSSPPGAHCVVARGSRVIADIAAAPGTVQLERSNHSLEVRCEAPGHVRTAALLRPEQDKASFRVAPTGVIGLTANIVATAAATNARYPGRIVVEMPPARFASNEEREAWFARRRAAITAARAPVIAEERAKCFGDETSVCETVVLKLERDQAEDLRRLEALRQATGVGGTAAATQPPASATPEG